MRWILFIILAYVAVVLQTTLGALLAIHTDWAGVIAPDLLAILAVFIALALRNAAAAALACWILGFGLDLASGPGSGSVVGPMALAYAGGGFLVFQFREIFFREKILSQVILVLVFALLTHVTWVTLQAVISGFDTTWGIYGQRLLEAVFLAVYSAALAPVLHTGLIRYERLLIPNSGRGRNR